MQYDNGEVLPGLNETWTFGGATLVEWGAGFAVFCIISLFGRSPATLMPFMLTGWVTTTWTLASVRRMFPDEERGLRNFLMTSCGIQPFGIPAPSKLQPVWSACPIAGIPKTKRFHALGLSKMFPSFEEALKPVDDD